jgi:hypothetical protein
MPGKGAGGGGGGGGRGKGRARDRERRFGAWLPAAGCKPFTWTLHYTLPIISQHPSPASLTLSATALLHQELLSLAAGPTHRAGWSVRLTELGGRSGSQSWVAGPTHRAPSSGLGSFEGLRLRLPVTTELCGRSMTLGARQACRPPAWPGPPVDHLRPVSVSLTLHLRPVSG